MGLRSVKPKRRRLPDASDDGPYRVFMIATFWVSVAGVVLLFVTPWYVGATVIGLALLCFLGAIVLGG
jgi:hypothetical protein